MNKLFLALLMLIIIGSLIACTNNEGESEEEATVQEAVRQVSTNEIEDEILEDNWDLSSIFEHSVVLENGQESYKVVGNQSTLGFTGPLPTVANKTQKYFWFYFGNETIYDKPVDVKAIKKGEKELIDVFSGTFHKGAELGPGIVNMPSHLRFPSKGVWKVLVYIDDDLYESIVVEVE
ncbi:hypothetical protein WAK64_06510 [Bacillus spongiae]|uniref:DUF4871 domain-containing protein n=1 Tax=Bacillus spongiae TaxID=2683610 RepID=A0ABU8HBK4_9BACI